MQLQQQPQQSPQQQHQQQQLYQQQLGDFFSLIKLPPAMLTDALAVLEQSSQLRLSPGVWQRQTGNENRDASYFVASHAGVL